MSLEPVEFESLGLRVNTAAYRADLDGRPLALEPKAFDLLVLLMSQSGQLVTKQQILERVWSGTAVTDNALTRVVAQLRKALGDDAREATYLETVPTRGYRWLAPVTRSDPGQSPFRVDVERTANATRTASDHGTTAVRPRSGRVMWAVSGFCVVAVLAGAWAWMDARRADQPGSLFPRQVTLSAGLDIYPALSPDGRRLAYSSDRSGTWEIFIKPVDGAAGEQALTSDGDQNVHAAWSPDGTSIAYHSMRRGGIWVIPAAGGAPRQVSSFGARPAWAPDSRRLAFQSDPAPDIGPGARSANLPSTIWVVDTTSGQPRPVTRRGSPAGGHGAPVWSPDGRRIAFSSADHVLSEVWAVDVAGGESERLSADVAGALDPAYLPDGRGLIFSSGAMIWRVPLGANGRATAAPRSFTIAGLANLRHFSVAPGGRLVASALQIRTELRSAAIDGEGRLLGEPQPITNDTRVRNSYPVFSPDGDYIAVTSRLAGEPPDIWVMKADGSALVQLTHTRAFDMMPNWMPDARHVTFKSVRDGRLGLWKVDMRSMREERLLDFGSSEENERRRGFLQEAELSPDGSRVAYALLDPVTSSKAIYVRALNSDQAMRITSGEPPASYPAWSPDGRWIACELFTEEGTTAAVVAASGGTPRPLTAHRGHSWVHSWSPDSERILFAGQRNGVWNVYAVSREGGPEVRVTSNTRVSNFIRYPTWSPRGNQIVFEQGEVRGNVWLIDLP